MSDQFWRKLFLGTFFAIIFLMQFWFLVSLIEEPEIITRDYRVQPAEGVPGSTFVLVGDILIKGDRRCRITIIRAITDSRGVEVATPQFERASITKEFVRIERPIIISPMSSPGEARIDATVEWTCNWPQRLFPRSRTLYRLSWTITDN